MARIETYELSADDEHDPELNGRSDPDARHENRWDD